DYLMILGSVDVIPHVPLTNPVYSPGDDDDKKVPSDLPYACEAAYSTDPGRYTGPTRVVGRLPDVTGAGDPTGLVAVIDLATAATTRSAGEYREHFGISAEIWKQSSNMSLSAIFGQPTHCKTIPPHGAHWPQAELAPLTHFINCHGGQRDSKFYGQ